jgi:DNA-binding transcriptional LysR family regulator
MGADQLVDEPWLLPAAGSFVRSIIEDAFGARGLRAPQPVVVASSNMRAALLASGRFVTALPRAMLQLGGIQASIMALPVSLPGQNRNVAIMTLKGRSLSPVAQLFIESAREVAKRLVLSQTQNGRGRSSSISARTKTK